MISESMQHGGQSNESSALLRKAASYQCCHKNWHQCSSCSPFSSPFTFNIQSTQGTEPYQVWNVRHIPVTSGEAPMTKCLVISGCYCRRSLPGLYTPMWRQRKGKFWHPDACPAGFSLPLFSRTGGENEMKYRLSSRQSNEEKWRLHMEAKQNNLVSTSICRGCPATQGEAETPLNTAAASEDKCLNNECTPPSPFS